MHGNAAPLRVVLRTLRAALLFVHSLTATYTVLVAPLRVVLRTPVSAETGATREKGSRQPGRWRGASHPCCCGSRDQVAGAGHTRQRGRFAVLRIPAGTALLGASTVPRFQPKVLENSKLPYI